MGKTTEIAWTDSTWNPWIGCAKISAGCANCYAQTLMDTRYGRVEWGPNGTRSATSAAYWKQPRAWNADLLSRPHLWPSQVETTKLLAAELGIELRWVQIDLNNTPAGWREVTTP